MAEHNLVYQMAAYYDIALKRDVSGEVDFLCDLFQQLNGRPLTSLLETACGPAYHGRACARRGIRATGLDLRPEMIAFAQEQAAAEGADLAFIVGDMCRFQLEQPVDMVIAMFDALDCLSDNQALVDHFRCVAANLNPGGLYVIDLAHPRDISLNHYGEYRYHGVGGGTEVDIRWAVNPPLLDLPNGTYQTDVEMTITENGQVRVLRDSARERIFYPQEIQLLAMLAGGLRPAAWFGGYDLNVPLDMSPGATRMVAVLQKTGAE